MSIFQAYLIQTGIDVFGICLLGQDTKVSDSIGILVLPRAQRLPLEEISIFILPNLCIDPSELMSLSILLSEFLGEGGDFSF
jgi:hypothetical protein